jgi:hypothetical protein
MGPGVDSAGVAGRPGVVYNPKPICAALAWNLFTDDQILSVAHKRRCAATARSQSGFAGYADQIEDDDRIRERVSDPTSSSP